MCGPEGAALFYCRKAIQPQLQLRQFGWHMMKDAFEFSHKNSNQPITENIVEGAQRFESGSPNMMGIAALNASLGLLLDIGIKKIEQQVLSNTDYLLKQLSSRADISIISPTQSGRYAGIVTFQKQAVDNISLYQYLQENNVICAFRGDGIRFSPHFHTATDDLNKALEWVDTFN